MPWSSKGSVDSNKYNSFQAHWLVINSRKVNSSNGILPIIMMTTALTRSLYVQISPMQLILILQNEQKIPNRRLVLKNKLTQVAKLLICQIE